YTQCPQCQTVYSVTTETLRQAGGQVECGQCRLRFNALPHLSETYPAANTKPEVATPQAESHGADTQAPASAPQTHLSDQQDDTGDPVPVAGSGAGSVPEPDHGTDAGQMPLTEQEPPEEKPEAHQTTQQPPYGDAQTGDQEQPSPQPGSEPDEHQLQVNAKQDEADTGTRSGVVSAEGEPDEEQEYDTWLRHLDREWDPTHTGTQDAWSRAAPQVDPPPDAAESGTVPHLVEDADAGNGAAHAQDQDESAEPTEEIQAIDRRGERQGLDTGISYIEAWAEDLLAAAERDDLAEPETATDEPEAGHSFGPDPSVTGVSAAEASAGPPQATLQTGTPAGDEAGAVARSEENAMSDLVPVSEAAATHADTDTNVEPGIEVEAEAEAEVRGEDQPDSDEDDKWLEETWATDTQSFQPEVWLEPDFVDQDALPEKLEGAGGEDDGEDHAATDPAIRTEADHKKTISDEIAGLWPDIDGDAEVEEIVLESPESAEPLQLPPGRDGPISGGDSKDDAGNIIALPDQTPTLMTVADSTADTTAAEAAAIAAAGKVQAAAVKVTTASQTEENDARLEDDDPASLAARAEEVAIELGLPYRRPWVKWASGLAVMLALLALIAAGIHSQRGVLMRNASIAPMLEKAYGVFGITVQPAWDIRAFDILDSSARSSDDDLIVMASFGNKAEFAQPYPVLRVTLENRWGQAIGQEDFSPRNYLRGYRAGRKMDAGERARAEVMLRSPGTAAEGFSVDLCLESANGALRCLADRP
ncbi:MAG: DUF3426 domain-containing protein, partial [Gammaproteobacteria bacterium]